MEFWEPFQHLFLGTGKPKKNLCRGGRSQDLLVKKHQCTHSTTNTHKMTTTHTRQLQQHTRPTKNNYTQENLKTATIPTRQFDTHEANFHDFTHTKTCKFATVCVLTKYFRISYIIKSHIFASVYGLMKSVRILEATKRHKY